MMRRGLHRRGRSRRCGSTWPPAGQVDLVVLGGSDQDGVVREEDGLGGLVRRELVPQDEVPSLVAPLQDGHQVIVGSTEVHFTLQTNNEKH